MTWTCVKEGPRGPEESEIKIPRVRLTGQGKMPVVDMRKLDSVFDEGLPAPAKNLYILQFTCFSQSSELLLSLIHI